MVENDLAGVADGVVAAGVNVGGCVVADAADWLIAGTVTFAHNVPTVRGNPDGTVTLAAELSPLLEERPDVNPLLYGPKDPEPPLLVVAACATRKQRNRIAA